MYQINVRNVNEALELGLQLLRTNGEAIKVRGQSTLELVSPLVTTYYQPTERVLFSPVRDANHFFHFFDSLWLLAGRNDVAFLKQFNSTIDTYSDNGMTFHGAYGDRLRHACAIDQIVGVAELLKREPTTRRAVMTLWRPIADLGQDSKDIPCNVAIAFLARKGRLDMTVFCRSNDVVWGAYGANAVQFSILHEVVSSLGGFSVGRYRQISNSFHVYNKREDFVRLQTYTSDDRYAAGVIKPYPIVKRPSTFLREVVAFCENPEGVRVYLNPFFEEVARPLWDAWRRHQEAKDGLSVVRNCKAEDWRVACQEWLARREVPLSTSTLSGRVAGSGDSTP